LEDYRQKVAQFSKRIKAEIAAIEVRLAAMRIIAATFEKPLLKCERQNRSIRPL
jgi:hypothetical protein